MNKASKYALLWALLALLQFLSFTLPYDLSKKLAPKGKLHIGLDYGVALASGSGLPKKKDATDFRNFHFSAYIQFKNGVETITDGQLMQMAIDAHIEITADMVQYGMNLGRKPKVMSVLAVDRYLFFASSQRGLASLVYSHGDSPVKRDLVQCQLSVGWPEKVDKDDAAGIGHKNESKCGEILAALAYYLLNPETELKGRKGRVIAVEWNGNLDPPGYVDKPPCGGESDEKSWGCKQFLERQGLQPIKGVTAAAYTLQELAGGVAIHDQLSLCAPAKEDEKSKPVEAGSSNSA